MNNLSKVLLFATGAVIGSVVTWKLIKTKYERIAQEEIDSVKVHANKTPRPSNNEKSRLEELEELKAYLERIKENGYAEAMHRKEVIKHDEEGMVEMNKPYVITPEEFEDSMYTVMSLTCYADNVLEDDWGEIIENPEELVGADYYTHFGEYEEDSVFIRNDEEQTDYELLRDLRKYSDVNPTE